MPNPKAPHRSVSIAPQMVSPLDQVATRLRRLGATADEVQQFRDAWDTFDEQWTPELRARFAAMPDAELRRAIVDARSEYADNTTTEDEAAAAAAERVYAEVVAEAGAHVEAAVPVVLEWVYADLDAEPARALMRARAVLQVEQAGRQRKTLTEPLEAYVAEHTTSPDPAEAATGPQDTLLGVPGPNPSGKAPEADSGPQGGPGVDAGGDGTPG